ncbi:MAG: hypothetical protein JWP88_1192 [Flaviaesturariibacter sp.]|nr:hypothetical protein [Flaviaesturariibacter sp.]
MKRVSPYLLGVFLSVLFFACQKERSFENGGPGKGYLQNAAGECSPKTIGGTYAAGTATTAANYVDVGVYVKTKGTYNIVSDTVNGYYFKGTGIYTDTGLVNVRLKAIGTPFTQGSDIFSFILDTTLCNITIPVVVGTGGGGSGSCNAAPNGTYFKDTVLKASNTVSLQHTYTTAGRYFVYTDTVNGYSFSDSVTVTAGTAANIVLKGSGKPLVAGSNNFTIRFGDASTCNFAVTVNQVTPPGTCPTVTPAGTYTAGTTLTTANKVSFTYTYAATGTYNVSTNTVNGYSFGTQTVTATAGTPVTITLTGAGTPTAAGSNTFNLTLGDATTGCTFQITVQAAPPPATTGDHYILTDNSWWSYNTPISTTDTLKRSIVGSVSAGGFTYKYLKEKNTTGAWNDSLYVRKSGNNYYEFNFVDLYANDTFYFDNIVVDSILFLKESVTSGATWSSPVYSDAVNGVPVKLRFDFTCTEANGSATVNGRTYTNVHKIVMKTMTNTNNGGYVTDVTWTNYYAQGIGWIYQKYDDGTDTYEIPIRFYQVF